MMQQYIFVLENDMFFHKALAGNCSFGFSMRWLVCRQKTKCAVCVLGYKLAENGSALAEGGDF
jgi:hypothetical protein